MWPDVWLHLVPFEHGEASDPYLVLALTFAGVVAAAGGGLWLARGLGRDPRTRPLAAAFSAGALFFLFFDLLKGTTGLGQQLAVFPEGRRLMGALLAAFAAGTVLLPAAERLRPGPEWLAWAWTLGLVMHGAGEGWIIGTEAASADLTGPLPVASFLLHKAAEAFTVPFVAAVALPWARVAALALAFAGATLAGGLAGHAFGSGDAALVLFAVGAGAMAAALLRLGRTADLTLRGAGALLLGVLYVYAAGLLHELG